MIAIEKAKKREGGGIRRGAKETRHSDDLKISMLHKPEGNFLIISPVFVGKYRKKSYCFLIKVVDFFPKISTFDD